MEFHRSIRSPIWDWRGRCTCKASFQESKAAYESLFAFWKDADKDLPMLLDAQAGI
jgi:hypothetical protein